MMHRAQTMTWPEVKKLAIENAIALLPIGSTEAHGPHLPLNVDVVIAEEVCTRVSARLEWETVMFPAATYSLTDFAAPFAGTITLPKETAQAFLAGVLRGLCGQFKRVAVVNHHLEPAHFQVVHSAANEVNAALGGTPRIVVADHRRKPTGPLLGHEFMHGGSHAGSYETSLMLAAAPTLVREDIRRGLTSLEIDLPGKIKGGAKDFLECGGTEAYFGAPAQATAEEGNRLFGIIVDATEAAIRTLPAA